MWKLVWVGFFLAFFLFLPDFKSRRQSFGFVRTAYEGAESWARKEPWKMGIIHGCGVRQGRSVSQSEWQGRNLFQNWE